MPSSDEILSAWAGIANDSFPDTIRKTFHLPQNDAYQYKAESFSMTLSQIEELISSSPLKWTYQNHDGVIEIPSADIEAYTSLFSPTTNTEKALRAFSANAKRYSPRAGVAKHLDETRLLPTTGATAFQIPRQNAANKEKTTNPYYDIWAWTCQYTGFVGPLNTPDYESKESVKQTHPILPVLYHHFGCVCPSWEALCIISQLVAPAAQGKEAVGRPDGILDMASGNGYWTYLLRRQNLSVQAVDNLASSWRTMWIDDTIKADGVEHLKRTGGARDKVLLMVYMVTRGNFTKQVLKNYKGNVVVVVGTQNANRYTGFEDVGVKEYFEKEMGGKNGFELVVRVALPSFAGKDEAMFVFKRRT